MTPSRTRSRAGCGPSRRLPRPGSRRRPPPALPECAAPPSRCSGSGSRPATSRVAVASPSGPAARRSPPRSRGCRRPRGSMPARAAARRSGSDGHVPSLLGSDSNREIGSSNEPPMRSQSVTVRPCVNVPAPRSGSLPRLVAGRAASASLAASPQRRASGSCGRPDDRLHRPRRHGRRHGGEPGARRRLVTGFDLRPAALAELVAAGGRRRASPRAAAEGADLLVVMVVNQAQVEDVLFGAEGAAAAFLPAPR